DRDAAYRRRRLAARRAGGRCGRARTARRPRRAHAGAGRSRDAAGPVEPGRGRAPRPPARRTRRRPRRRAGWQGRRRRGTHGRRGHRRRVRRADVRALAVLQRDLLAGAAALVRPGGSLLYSVCTVTPEETIAVDAW